MTKRIQALLFLMLALSLCIVTVQAEESLGVSGVNLKQQVVSAGNEFSKMTTMDIMVAFDMINVLPDEIDQNKYSDVYDMFLIMKFFRAGWLDLEGKDYFNAYAKLNKLRSIPWTGENAETINSQVDVLRKYSLALYQMNDNKADALKSFESIEMNKVVFPEIRRMLLEDMNTCAEDINQQAAAEFSIGNYQKSLELYEALLAGEYYPDTGSMIKKLQDLSKPPAESPDIVISSFSSEGLTPFSQSISWQDTVNTNDYVVSYAPRGVEAFSTIIVENKTSLILDELIPETDYEVGITVKGLPSAAFSGSFRTLTPQSFNEFKAKYQLVSLYKYEMEKERTYGLQSVVNTDQIIKTDTNLIQLPPSDMGRSETGYVILASFMCDPSESDKVLNCRGVMRFNEGGTYQVISDATVDGDRSFVSLFFPLSGMLDEHYRNSGFKWQGTSVRIDVYMQYQYFGSITCGLQP